MSNFYVLNIFLLGLISAIIYFFKLKNKNSTYQTIYFIFTFLSYQIFIVNFFEKDIISLLELAFYFLVLILPTLVVVLVKKIIKLI